MKQYSLRALRGNKEYTQKEASKLIGVSATTLLRWEKGETYPNAKQINKICQIYDCDASSIFFKNKLLKKSRDKGECLNE